MLWYPFVLPNKRRVTRGTANRQEKNTKTAGGRSGLTPIKASKARVAQVLFTYNSSHESTLSLLSGKKKQRTWPLMITKLSGVALTGRVDISREN